MYVCVCACVCVCVCVRACVWTRARVCVCVSVSGYAVPHFSTYPLQSWWEHYMGHDTWRGLYMLVCAGNMRECVCVLSMHAWVRSPNFDGVSPNLLGTYYESPQVSWAMGYSCSCTARAFKHSLIFGRILSKFDENILRITTSNTGYELFMFMHCKCERARVFKHSLIFGRILSIFSETIQ
jgi:hypothetical protein